MFRLIVFVLFFNLITVPAHALGEFKITASDADALDEFGTAVSVSGDYAIVSASRNSDDGYRSGAAYIFVRNGDQWIEQTKLTAVTLMQRITLVDRFASAMITP